MPVFYIVARRYTETSSGIKAMHLLCNRLNRLGFEAYLVPADKTFLTDQKLVTPVISRMAKNQHIKSNRKVIAIYDESIIGNPLKGDLIIIWHLNHPGLLAGRSKISKKENSMKYVYAKEIDYESPRLFINTVDYSFFKKHDPSNLRTLKLFYAGKLRGLGIPISKPEGSIEIFRTGPERQSREELRDLLSRALVLYLAEDSVLVLEAAICGCPSVQLMKYFQYAPFSLEDGGLGLSKDDSEGSLIEATSSLANIERYFATLEIRSNEDACQMALSAIAKVSQVNKKSNARHRVSRRSKIKMQLYKLIAIYKKSGVFGIGRVLYARAKEHN
jgi:hypothetical protein